ncbi:UbiA prenyltransferase [Thermococcus onnurineus NA1]|uniref:UbiA prenyltransferase n=1 Tax=Thermococcus onnurineus (strain NA1) TaxID=523850 RepID=B6YU95_THEON|nr:UbiA prenyltransferase [Thermococcus onnurineus NA1]
MLTFLISTSIFLAASGVFKLYFSFLLYGIAPRWNLLAATFLLVFSVYGINKLTDIKEDEINNPERVEYVKKVAKLIKYAVLLSLVLAVILSALTSPWAILVVLFPIIAGALYSIRLLPGYPRLKDITGVKNATIAITWANGTTFLPYLVAGSADPQKVALIYYFFFMKSMVNTILFDVRDIEGDRMSGIQTVPVKLGKERSKRLLLLMNSTFIPWLIMAHAFGYFEHYLPMLVFAVLNGYGYILYFTRKDYKPGKSLDVWVDGEWFYTLALAMLV